MKVNYCFLERFNNYFNRKLIRYTDLQDYEDNSQASFVPLNSENSNPALFDFNPNDNITSEIIVNDVPFDPDYFLILDPEDESIVQRWFVLEQKRNRKGQWTYFLRRDVLADSFNEILNAPLYIERGIINNLESALLLNNEDLRVNQIKKQEILLKDKTGCPWLVMYVNKGIVGNNYSPTVNVDNGADFAYKTLTTPITSWEYYQYSQPDQFYKLTTLIGFTTRFNYVPSNLSGKYQYKIFSTNPWQSEGTEHGLGSWNSPLVISTRWNWEQFDNGYSPSVYSMETRALLDFGLKITNPLSEFNGKIIKDSQGKFFEIAVTYSGTKYEQHAVTTASAPLLKSLMLSAWQSATGQTTATANDDCFKVDSNYVEVYLTITPRPDLETTFKFADYTGKGTQDSMLFDAICMPYGVVRMYGSGSLVDYTSSPERSLLIMNDVARQLGKANVLDLQILPFCPVQNLLRENDNLVHISYLHDTAICGEFDNDYTDFMIVCEKSNFSFDIAKKIQISDNSNVPSTYKRKYLNDCTTIRICSPNYCGVFEMNLAKNGGQITRFNFDVTLRPFNPYIHVNPDFSFLYGQDFNDQRGLVCGGDFSLGIINDAWVSYEIQNKNYQAIFDRQIQNLDLNNAINYQEATWGAVAGTVQGTASGAIAGGMLGGGYGAIAGAVLGGTTSLVGGVMDLENLQKRQQEARNYAIDNYSLSLGNIRALPYSITKTSALTFNNKLFVFVEIYECSEEEKEAYYLKLRYNGMSVRKIGNILGYMSQDNSNYFRGRVIRIEDISEDNHYFEAINEELMKGVFI